MQSALVISLLIAAVASPAGVQDARPQPRVFVHTEPGGEATEAAGRLTSVKDLSSALAAKKKKVTLVETRDDADLIIEILDRGLSVPRVVIGLGSRPGQPPGDRGPVRTVVLRARLTRGDDDAVVFKNKNTPFESPAGWKGAADDIAKQIEKWIDDRWYRERPWR